MVAGGFGCDLHYFIKYASGKVKDELLKELSTLSLFEIPERSTLVSMKAVVHKDWQSMGVAERCAYEKAVHMVNKGYMNEFTLVINPFTLRVLKRFGARVWKDVSFEWKGNKLTRYIILRDMRIMAGHQNAKL